ncbi:MAG TPA: DNA-processing protein DprA [Verrucomicrobiae bacterium]|nr:DNA-processing protein DprA [Verrucomicrobiae bacterium]
MAAPTHEMPLDDAAFAWLALALVPELLPRRVFALVERFGTPRAVLEAPAGALAACGVPPAVVASLGAAAGRARAETRKLARAAATLVAWSDETYPPALRQIAQPPLVLAVRGSVGGPGEPAIAIVGARRASDYGRRMAAELARGFAQAGVTVVSGLAAGVDAAAHHAALAAGGRTVAVLGTGIDLVYPKWHRELARAIAGQGALVSEFPCGSPPLQFHFPRRNRIISGLTRGTIVVEAADDSGSLITAGHALEQDRQVFAVPGPVGVTAHSGTNRLIQQGARLVVSARDVVEELWPELLPRLAAERAAAAEAALTVPERQLLAAIGPESRHVDDLIRRAAVPPGAALETLLALELRGLVCQLPGKRFCRRAA